jgi:LacI family transcriptional regulator
MARRTTSLRAAVTLKRVAAHAGVSVPTASTVLNGAGGNTVVSEDTRARIVAAARDLDYRPNHHARSLKSGRSGAIGLLLDPPRHAPTNEAWLAGMSRGAEVRARDRGIDLIIIGAIPARGALDRGLDYASERKVDALLTYGAKPSLAGFDPRRLGVPMVLLWDDPHGTGLPTVAGDEAPAHHELVRHLGQLGHRRALYVGQEGDPGSRTRYQRLGAAAASTLAIDAAWVAPPPGKGWGFAELIAHYRRQVLPLAGRCIGHTAIVCHHDLLGLALQQVLWEVAPTHATRIALASFDDLFAHFGHPALTSVDLGLAAIGARAVDHALALVRGAEIDPSPLPARLIVRESSRPR